MALTKFFLSGFLVIFANCTQRRTEYENYLTKDTLTIEEIRDATNVFYAKMASNNIQTDQEYIWIGKIYNTISVMRLKEQNFSKFDRMFANNYLNNIVNKFKAEESSGMGFYIRDFDLLIGGNPQFSPNSYYKIEQVTTILRKTK